MLDLQITNALLLDLSTGKETLSDVGIRNGRIAEIKSAGTSPASAHFVYDAEGNYLFPGFVDFHTHLFRHGSTFGMNADLLLSAGVTAAADMGSAGWVNFPALYCCDLLGKTPRISAFLNISPVGQPGRGIAEPLDDGLMAPEEMKRLLREYPGVITGLKVRLSRGIVRELGIRPLENAVRLGEELGLSVCVHTTDPPVSMDRIAAMLRPGDIMSHTYQGQGHTSAENEEVLSGMLEAKARGVLMEVGNGSKNFNFLTGERCLEAGLTPDIISSDATPTVFHNSPAMWDLPRVVSKFVNLGVPLTDCIRAVTETPAKVLGMDHVIGKIAPGYEADLAVFRNDSEVITFCDSDGNERKGPRGLTPLATFLKGQLVWNSRDLS
ncbi:MAG: amidohydrolase family protein [Stomatobaculum sp.]|nr:amidohydrolase family protein [Stomatobaculum sp.]